MRNGVRERARRAAARPGERRGIEELLLLAEYLPLADRRLVEAVFRDGRAVRHLAELGGRDHRHVLRRLHRVLDRLRSPAFRLVALRGERLSDRDRRAAEHLFLAGRSLRETARLTGQPFHRVRRTRETIRQLVTLFTPECQEGGPG